MKVALCSTMVPFIDGGARQIVEWLEHHLRERGHQVERVYLPEVDAPSLLYRQMMAFRQVDLSMADRLICFRPQSHLVPHDAKVLWFIHHVRVLYDLWDSPYRDFSDSDKHIGIRDAIRHADDHALREARSVFTNSRVVGDRLRRFNGVDSTVLYPPVFAAERFRCDEYGDEVVYISRLEQHKRQGLLIEAIAHTTTPVRARICGSATNPAYAESLRSLAAELGVADRVTIEDRWITEDDKARLLAGCLANCYLPADEDSYGYPTLEAAHASKATVSTSDAGGVLEFVEHGVNGTISPPDPASIALELDQLYEDRARARALGEAASTRIGELGITWDTVVERLLA